MAEKKPRHKVKGRRKIAEGKPRREIVEVEIAEGNPRCEIVEVDIAGKKPHSPRISRQLSAREVEREREIVEKRPRHKVKGRHKIAEGKTRRERAEEKPTHEVERELEIAEGNPPGMSWSSVRIDNTAYTWGTNIALPGGSRREVERGREMVEKRPRREVKRERERVGGKPRREIGRKREKEQEEIAFFKKWAVLPLPTSKTTEVEEKPTHEVKRRREMVEKRPRREVKRERKIIEEKITPAIVEEKPKLEIKRKRNSREKAYT